MEIDTRKINCILGPVLGNIFDYLLRIRISIDSKEINVKLEDLAFENNACRQTTSRYVYLLRDLKLIYFKDSNISNILISDKVIESLEQINLEKAKFGKIKFYKLQDEYLDSCQSQSFFSYVVEKLDNIVIDDLSKIEDNNLEALKLQIITDLTTVTAQLQLNIANVDKVRYSRVGDNFFIYLNYSDYGVEQSKIQNAVRELLQEDKLKEYKGRYCVTSLYIEGKSKRKNKDKMDSSKQFLDEFLSKQGIELTNSVLEETILKYINGLKSKKAFNISSMESDLIKIFKQLHTDQDRINVINDGIEKNNNSLVYVLKNYTPSTNNQTSVNNSSVKKMSEEEIGGALHV